MKRSPLAIDRERRLAIKHLRVAVKVAESWIHDQLDGTGLLDGALAEIQPARDFLNKLEAK